MKDGLKSCAQCPHPNKAKFLIQTVICYTLNGRIAEALNNWLQLTKDTYLTSMPAPAPSSFCGPGFFNGSLWHPISLIAMSIWTKKTWWQIEIVASICVRLCVYLLKVTYIWQRPNQSQHINLNLGKYNLSKNYLSVICLLCAINYTVCILAGCDYVR